MASTITHDFAAQDAERDERLWQALQARDPRFDGVFFVGVSSTGIYCRCVCPARTPGRTRCSFHPSPAAAESAGFRPCRRCRPDVAPGLAPMDAAGRLARAAYARIEAGWLDGGRTAADLASSLGTSDRHLRRVLSAAFGASPGELVQSARLRSARRLLSGTALPLAGVASAAGFGSLRRMQDVFRRQEGRPPSAWRSGRRTAASDANGLGAAATLRFAMRPPVAWNSLLGFLAAHAVPGVELVGADRDGKPHVYRRTLAIAGHAGWLSVQPLRGADPQDCTRPFELELLVSDGLLPVAPVVLARVRHLLDADARPDAIAEDLAGDPLLAPLVARRPGLRVPGSADALEGVVRIVLGQQVSMASAACVHARVAEAFGEPIDTPVSGLDRLPPTAATLAEAAPDRLGRLGVLRQRTAAIQGLARAMADGELLLEPGADPEAAAAAAGRVRGVGPWTAGCLALRTLGWPDAWPAGDRALLVASGLESLRALDARAEAWRPWRAYAAVHLWHEIIEGRGAAAGSDAPRSREDGP